MKPLGKIAEDIWGPFIEMGILDEDEIIVETELTFCVSQGVGFGNETTRNAGLAVLYSLRQCLRGRIFTMFPMAEHIQNSIYPPFVNLGIVQQTYISMHSVVMRVSSDLDFGAAQADELKENVVLTLRRQLEEEG